jgi:hypothetical protein
MKANKPTYKQLEYKLLVASASTIYRYTSAHKAIEKATDQKYMGSGILLQLTDLSGNTIIDPVLIRDGLSSETIKAIQNDIKKSYDLATMYKL